MLFRWISDEIPCEKPACGPDYDEYFVILTEVDDIDLPVSRCSTSESGLSNSFLEEALMGHYEGWTAEHNRWQGRWVRDGQMKKLLYSMQSFQFLNLQTFLSEPMSGIELGKFAEGTKLLDEFLANSEMDIVHRNKRFPEVAYHFVDDDKWTKTFNDLYTVLKYIQQPDMDLIQFYTLWIEAIVPAITKHLPEKITREKFEIDHRLVWNDPTFVCATESGSESGRDEDS